MKLVSWGIVFVIIIFSFSFSLRVILDNKMEIMKKEIEYNNALNEATLDATKELADNMGYEYSTEYEDPRMILNAMNRFFETFGLSFGYYGGNTKTSQIRMYVPAILTMSYNGFYVYHMENVEGRFEHTLTPKQYYATQSGGLNINFTLDDYVRVDQDISLEGIDSETYTNAYSIGKRFKDIYTTPYEVLESTGFYNPNAYSYDDTLIGDIDRDNHIDNNDLTNLQTIVWDFWDLEYNATRSDSSIYYKYNHTDFEKYATYWYADINQDGYIDQYDVDILNDYLSKRHILEKSKRRKNSRFKTLY